MENNINQEQKNNQGNTKPNIYIFGEEIKRDRDNQETKARHHEYHVHKHYHGNGHRHGSGIFGLLLLFMGVTLLLTNVGLVSMDFWQFVIPFWPVLLILLGVKIILGRNWFSSIVIFILTFAFLSFLFIYGLIKVNSSIIEYFPLTPETLNSINNNFYK